MGAISRAEFAHIIFIHPIEEIDGEGIRRLQNLLLTRSPAHKLVEPWIFSLVLSISELLLPNKVGNFSLLLLKVLRAVKLWSMFFAWAIALNLFSPVPRAKRINSGSYRFLAEHVLHQAGNARIAPVPILQYRKMLVDRVEMPPRAIASHQVIDSLRRSVEDLE
jgi:hypothetical protein